MPTFPAWARTVDEVLEHHDVAVGAGLSAAEVETRRARWGFNELEKAPATPLWKLILAQFDDTLVKVGRGTLWRRGVRLRRPTAALLPAWRLSKGHMGAANSSCSVACGPRQCAASSCWRLRRALGPAPAPRASTHLPCR